MSLAGFLQAIENSGIGRTIQTKAGILSSTNPERIYIENIRSFFNLSFTVAKFLCEMAVKQNLFTKKVGITCPNESCNRIIMSVDSLDEIPTNIHCEHCELLEKDKYSFRKSEIETVIYYKLNKGNSGE